MFEYQKVISVDGKPETVVFPNVGKMIEMESMKQALTSNKYGVMASSGVKSMYITLDVIDAIVFFKVNLPFLVKRLNVDSYEEMLMPDAQKLVEVYKKQIRPWYVEQLEKLYELSNDEQNDDEDSEE